MRAANGRALTNDFISVRWEVECGVGMCSVANVFKDRVNECVCDVARGV